MLLNSTEHGIYFAHNVKIQTIVGILIVGILTFISKIKTTSESFNARFFFSILVLMGS